MSNPNQPIRLEPGDLYSPQVENYLQMQQALRRDVGQLPQQSWVVRVLYSSWFYLSLASGLGAFLAWAILEPFFEEGEHEIGGAAFLVGFLMFPTVAGVAGLFLGAAEGIMCRNLGRAALSGIVGLGIGFVGGALALIPAEIFFFIVNIISDAIVKNGQGSPMSLRVALVLIIMGRATAWAVTAIPAGLGQGIALRDKKVAINGLLGGVLGGLVGGLLFDPISIAFTSADGRAGLSRAVGFTIIGLMVGLFVGLVEGWTKTAWLLMRAGPLAGKQFVLFRDITVLGSSPKAEVYLFKDGAIEPRHAVIYNRGGRFEIEDCSTRDGTYVNGVPIKREILNHGDQVVLGKTVLQFSLKKNARD